jgi:Tol biopolymer transport system component
MTDFQWKRVFEIYETAATLPKDAVRTLLESSSEDPAVLRKVSTILESLPPEEAREAVYAGRTVGRYHVIALIGSGSTGDVYAGRDRELDRPVALKFMTADYGEAGKGARSFLREAQAASALNHPNIVTVHEVILHESSAVIVMELVEGAALRNLCGTALPLPRALQIASQILQAVAFAHSRGMVHRDLKPENIIVRSDGYVKVLDFGLARQTMPAGALEQSSNLGLPVGTLRYMSPEQCRGEQATTASDVFSAGIILYEILTGRHPFHDKTPFGTAHAILESEPEPPAKLMPRLPAALNRLVLRMLAKRAEERPSATESAAALLLNPQANHRRRKVVAAASALLLAAGLTFLAIRLREPDRLYEPQQITRIDPGNYVTAAAVAPDGLSIAFAELDGSLHLRNTEGTVDQIIAHFDHNRVNTISWTPGQRRLLLSSREVTADSYSYPIWLLDLDTATPRRLPVQGLHATPSRDGAKIAYLSPNGADLWVADSAGGQPRQLVVTNGELRWFAWSPDNSLLYYGSVRGPAPWGSESWMWSTIDPGSGRLVSEHPSDVTLWPFLLPGGRFLSYVIGTPPTLVESQFDPATGVVSGKPRKLAGFAQEGLVWGQLSASQDARTVVAVMEHAPEPHVFVADLTTGSARLKNIRRLTLDGAEAYTHSWSADSKSVILESAQLHGFRIFIQPIDSKNPDPLVTLPGWQILPMLSPDGHWILFLSRAEGEGKWRLMRVPAGGGTPEEVPTGGPVQDFDCKYQAKRCVMREVANNQSVYYELDPIKGKGRELARVAAVGVFGDYSLSPDGSMVSTTNIGHMPATIRITYLDRAPLQKEIQVEGPPTVGCAIWAPDGSGWYLPTADQQTRFIDWAGHSRFVYDTGHWMVPSWDGKHMAPLDSNHSTNVWLVRR